MYYINTASNESGNHGNPVSHQSEGMVALPESLISEYINTRGFANLVIEDEVVSAITINQEAYDAYIKEHPDIPEEEETPTQLDVIEAQVLYTALKTDTLLEVQ